MNRDARGARLIKAFRDASLASMVQMTSSLIMLKVRVSGSTRIRCWSRCLARRRSSSGGMALRIRPTLIRQMVERMLVHSSMSP